MSIYVEIRIAAPMEEIWRLTQTPQLHEQWDLRFTSITYLGRSGESEPQRFRYATRLGFGLEVEGWGETVGGRQSDGTRTSALRFGSGHPFSLIRQGSGYWKYEEGVGGIRFITGYDYQVRGGALGRLLDRLMFRPLIGWATAWSFDRLRLWLESGVAPRSAARQAASHAIAVVTVALVWIWQGFAPKLAGPHPGELALLSDAGLPQAWLYAVSQFVGAAEVAFGLALIPLARRRWPWLLTIALMVVATAGVLVNSPEWAMAPFNPLTLNLLLAAMAAVGLLSLPGLPSAGNCLRRPPRKPAGQEEGEAA